MCGGLLERPLILAEVVPRYSVMLELFDAELDNTKILYDTQIAASADGNIPPIHKNMPPVAGQLKWRLPQVNYLASFLGIGNNSLLES